MLDRILLDDRMDYEGAGVRVSCLYPKSKEVKSGAKEEAVNLPLPLLPVLQRGKILERG